MTSELPKAMQAASMGGSLSQFWWQDAISLCIDAALQFIEAAENPLEGAYVFNMSTDSLPV